AGCDGHREARTMSQLPEQPFSMVDCPFHTKRWPLNPQLLPTPNDLLGTPKGQADWTARLGDALASLATVELRR
ncbi:hypothetical protein, partial [Marivita sp. LZ-15-2]|uniref:hypothetical protein n=1 Tax=Marivita sp. LZ-15-2 TaxID=2570353 RepID=UPI001BB18215